MAQENDIGEYVKYLKSQGTPAKDAEDYGRYLIQSQGKVASNLLEHVSNSLSAFGRNALQTGPVAQLAAALRGKKVATPTERLADVISNPEKIPGTKEYLKSLGFKGTDLSLGTLPVATQTGQSYAGNPYNKPINTLDIAGKIGDIGTDVLGQELVGMGTSAIGRGLFDIPFWGNNAKALEDVPSKGWWLKKEGPTPGNTVWDRGYTPGTREGIRDSYRGSAKGILKERNALEAPVIASDERGLAKNAVKDQQEYVDTLKSSGDNDDRILGERLQKKIDAQLALGEQAAVPEKIVPKQSSILGSDNKPMMSTETIPATPAQPGPTYSDLMDVKNSAWKNRPKDVTDAEHGFYNAKGAGAAEESYDVANRVSPGLGAKIKGKNTEASRIFSVLPDADRKALVEASKSPVTQTDLWALGLDPLSAGFKQAGKIAALPAPYTYGGRTLYGLGKGLEYTSPLSAVLNQAPYTQPSAWELMNMYNKEGQ